MEIEKGFYGPITSAQDTLYENACALDNQDVPLEEWPNSAIRALFKAGFVIVPRNLPFDVLGEAAITGVFETGNPKHGWDYLLNKVQIKTV